VRTWAVATFSPYQVVDYSVNSSTLAYLAATSAAVAILVSIAPICRVVRIGVSGALRGDARGVTEGPRGKQLAGVLVAGQMVLAIVLLSGAGVLVRSFVAIVGANTGIRNPEHLLVGSLRLPSDKYSSPDARRRYFDRLDAQLRTIPGMLQETVATTLPVSSVNLRTFEIDGRPGEHDLGESAQFLSTGPDYFRLVGASPVCGRDFDDRDRAAALPVAVVNESFAATFWPGEQPLGKRIRAIEQRKPEEWRLWWASFQTSCRETRSGSVSSQSFMYPSARSRRGGAPGFSCERVCRRTRWRAPFEPRYRNSTPMSCCQISHLESPLRI
jgi:hypothetical protein